MKKQIDVVFATNNKNKLIELERIFSSYASQYGVSVNILSLKEIGYTDEIVEDGSTYRENAFIKADTVCKAVNMIAVGDDSGLSVDALDGRPGVYSARYAGDGSAESNRKKLLAELEGVEYERRTASFICCICCRFPDGRTIYADGKCDGYILFEETGDKGFGYDPLFYYPPFKKSFAEADEKEKDAVSHRGKALCEFARIFFCSIDK